VTPIPPKDRLLRNKPLAEQIRKLMATLEFEQACDVAMLQYVQNQSYSNDGVAAAATHYRLEGARSFLVQLQQIADEVKLPQQQQSGLRHDV
jgi:hypothetical protein